LTTDHDIEALVSEVPLGSGHDDQERVVAAALHRLLVQGQQGVVLADEVGFGKTYEALAVLSHLCAHARRRGRPFDRALVLCKPALVRKWEEETSLTRAGRGFPRYLPENHPACELFGHEVRCIDNRATARELRHSGVRGQLLDGRQQVPPGLYIVNEKLLQEEKRKASTLMRQIWRTRWDVVIVDEAHHYARGNRPMLLFAPDGDLRNYDQPSLTFDKVIALTATPFELKPDELVSLLALVRADRATLDALTAGLQNFVRALDRFFELRERSPTDPLRQQQVALLQRLRDEDALKLGTTGNGLQGLLRRFLIRNSKGQNERRYFLVERDADGFKGGEFLKLDEDLQHRVRQSPLIPFEGEHTLFYLELRELLQEVTERARGGDESRTFIPTDLRQGLSSYRQIAASKLLDKDLESARRIRALVTRWNKDRKLHPKVAALIEVVRGIVDVEIRKVMGTSDTWLSKILIFNKMIRGTAPQLTEVLGSLLESAFDQCLVELLAPTGISRDDLGKKVRRAVDQQLDTAEQELKADRAYSAWRHVPEEFGHKDFMRYHRRSMLQVFREPLRRRAGQTLALIDLTKRFPELDELQIAAWVDQEVTGRVVRTLRAVIDRYLNDSPRDEATRETMLDHAERDLIVELEESKAVALVGRFDGRNTSDREAHRRNFNRRHNPFVLLVGQVGEEGIDLQEQCRYVIHYDLEWNPARMEQREGRVDRMGWGRASEGYIDVRFLLLKGTYEERIFHTVMQRDQWFQILIGSKKKELGLLPSDVDHEVDNEGGKEIDQDRITDDGSTGALTNAEKIRVMLDLRPE
jgi:SNF2 family DNA or RNA helicase